MLSALALTLGLLLAPEGCVQCHAGIEDMHPKKALSCVECHGGDAAATTKEAAHVKPARPLANDERTLPLDYDLPYLRFLNPTNLRVASQTCGGCHVDECADLYKSLHGTTSGHLSDGYYENGVTRSKSDAYAIFKEGSLSQVPAFTPKSAPRGKPQTIADHYGDLPRKACMQCHLWSRGRAVRGRLGMDGDYRSEGCAACHVIYANDGLSRSADPTVNKLEPGHPRSHAMTSAVSTDQCVRCHYGDASIGLSFRGMAQLIPGMPAGPDIPGTTKSRLNGTFYVQDPTVCPPDIHHEKGMHCIDCHTFGDVMGDGTLPTKMENAVEIECVDCHGTFKERATLVTQKRTKLDHIREENGRVILRSKVTGKDHPVPQVVDVLTPGSPRYSGRAAQAMNEKYSKLECYTCHAGWSPNFFGFHFDRNEQFTQLEVLSGERTPGRVSTQEKVFGTFRNILFGWAPEGTIQPYMVGFSTMGTVHDKDGKKIIDQGMPKTAAGLSGRTLVHHNLHTTRPEARACVECHRNEEALGLGGQNFKLARDMAFAASNRGLESVGLDRGQPEASVPLATLAMKDARALALVQDVAEAFAKVAVVARAGGVAVVDVRNAAFPKEIGSVALADAYDVDVRGSKAYVAAGKDGVAVIDLEKPDRPKLLGKTGSGDVRKLALAGFHAFALDAGGKLLSVDLAQPSAPKVVQELALDDEGRDDSSDEPGAIVTWWQWSRPEAQGKKRSVARRVLAVSSMKGVLQFADATEPAAIKLYPRAPEQRNRLAKLSVRGLAYSRAFDLGSEGGGVASVERDYLYIAGEEERGEKERTYLLAIDVTAPERPQPRGRAKLPGDTRSLKVMNIYNPPFVQRFVLASSRQASVLVDVSRTDQQLQVIGRLGGEGPGALRGIEAVAVEEMAFDRLIDWDGRAEKDISHAGARYFSRDEALRILRAPVPMDDPPPAGPRPGAKGREDAKREEGKKEGKK